MSHSQFRKVSILMATAFVDMIGFAMVLPLLPFYANHMGAEDWMIGPLVASFALAQLASAPLWGRVSDRYGRRPVILFGLCAGAIAYTIFGLASALWLLFASRLAQGVGGGTTGVLQAYVADSTDPSQRARGLGWLSAATSGGIMIGPAIGSFADRFWGPMAPGFIAAGLCLANLAFAARWLPESRAAKAQDQSGTIDSQAPPRRSIRALAWEVLRRPTGSVAHLVWIYAVGMGAFTAMAAVLPLFLMYRFGVTEETIGFFFVYVGFLSVIIRAVVLGWLVDRFGESKVVRIGLSLLIIGFGTIPLASSLPLFVMAVSCMPIGIALLFPSTSAMVTHRTRKDQMGQTLGVQQAFGGVARVIGPIWGAAAFQGLGMKVPFFASSVLALLMLGFFFAMGAHHQEPVAEEAGSTAG